MSRFKNILNEAFDKEKGLECYGRAVEAFHKIVDGGIFQCEPIGYDFSFSEKRFSSSKVKNYMYNALCTHVKKEFGIECCDYTAKIIDITNNVEWDPQSDQLLDAGDEWGDNDDEEIHVYVRLFGDFSFDLWFNSNEAGNFLSIYENPNMRFLRDINSSMPPFSPSIKMFNYSTGYSRDVRDIDMKSLCRGDIYKQIVDGIAYLGMEQL